jgi:hypothetical protein
MTVARHDGLFQSRADEWLRERKEIVKDVKSAENALFGRSA